jgi:hypothetical protein
MTVRRVIPALYILAALFETRPAFVNTRSFIVWILGARRQGCNITLSELFLLLFTSKVKEEEEGKQTETESLVD